MKNIRKNLMLGLTGVCVIAIIYFFIELAIINSNAEPRDTGSVVVDATPDADIPGSGINDLPADPPDSIGGENPGGDDGYIADQPETPRPPPRGRPYEFLVDEVAGEWLIVYAQDELFEYAANDWDWSFIFRGGGNASLAISFYPLTPQGEAADAEDFLRGVLGEDTVEFRGTQPILESGLNGVAVMAHQGSVTYEAWLSALGRNNIAIALLINYEYEDQRDALYEVINSMYITDQPPGQDINTDEADPAGTDPEG